MWGGSRKKAISVKISKNLLEDHQDQSFAKAVCEHGSGMMDQLSIATFHAMMVTECGHRSCTENMAWLMLETNIITWWVVQHGETLKQLIDLHEKEYEEDANRATDQLLGQLGKKTGNPDNS